MGKVELKPGSRWRSDVCDTEVVVVRPANTTVTLECGGSPMLPIAATRSSNAPAADRSGGTLVGKRYADAETGIEVLGSKAGQGSLSLDGRLLLPKEPKPLPASD